MRPTFAIIGVAFNLAVWWTMGVGHAETCPAKCAKPQIARCMVYLPAMRDVELKRWCLKQSERMP
jgi:hypothetical protein